MALKYGEYFNRLDQLFSVSKVRFVCISDTHSRTDKLHESIPAGDILLHAGDFTAAGSLSEVKLFNDFLGSIKNRFKHIIVIAGICFNNDKINKNFIF